VGESIGTIRRERELIPEHEPGTITEPAAPQRDPQPAPVAVPEREKVPA
jgi:hypothetical protein